MVLTLSFFEEYILLFVKIITRGENFPHFMLFLLLLQENITISGSSGVFV